MFVCIYIFICMCVCVVCFMFMYIDAFAYTRFCCTSTQFIACRLRKEQKRIEKLRRSLETDTSATRARVDNIQGVLAPVFSVGLGLISRMCGSVSGSPCRHALLTWQHAHITTPVTDDCAHRSSAARCAPSRWYRSHADLGRVPPWTSLCPVLDGREQENCAGCVHHVSVCDGGLLAWPPCGCLVLEY